MATPRGYGLNGKSIYTNVTKPMTTWTSFTVTPTNGLGVTSVKSNGYANYVFMHTSTTPTTSNGITNPNPPNGYAVIGLKNNFNSFLGLRWEVDAPATNASTTATTANVVYTITALGTATAAQWQAKGLPAWLTPTVGQSFVATASGTIGGSAMVGTAGVPNVNYVSVVGDPNQTIASSNVAQYGGAYLVLQFGGAAFTGTALGTHTHDLLLKNAAVADGTTTRVNAGTNLLGANTGSDITVAGSGANGGIVAASAGTPAGTIAAAATAPTTGSIIRLELVFDGSSVTIDGL